MAAQRLDAKLKQNNFLAGGDDAQHARCLERDGLDAALVDVALGPHDDLAVPVAGFERCRLAAAVQEGRDGLVGRERERNVDAPWIQHQPVGAAQDAEDELERRSRQTGASETVDVCPGLPVVLRR